MNPATHLYKTSVLAIRTAALAAALYVTTSAPARTAHTANPTEGGGEMPRPNPTRTSCAITIRASRSIWESGCGAFRCPWTTTATV